MSEYHESWHALPEAVRDAHRALASLKEEVEAIDWYHQRVALAGDADLKAALAHNRDEEVEHACMMIEWLRRNMPAWDEALRVFLFSEGPLTEVEEKFRAGEAAAKKSGSLGIGGLKERK